MVFPVTCSRCIFRFVRLSCLLLVWFASWHQGSVEAQEYSRPVRVGTISDPRIDEISGMVPITGRRDYFWVHNDSKDAARLFAVRKDGALVAEVDLPGASNTDYEDIATGPGSDPTRVYLFIADTGNNALNRNELVIWRLPEPSLPSVNLNQSLVAERSEAIRFRYPAGTYNNESLIVHPATGILYLITKVNGPAGVYRFPRSTPGGAVQTLVLIATMNIGGLVTAADLTGDGRRMLVRTFPAVQEYRLPDGVPFERIFTQPRIILPNAGAAEPKSESICFDLDDRDFFTSNEGNPAPIHQTSLLREQPFCVEENPPVLAGSFTRGDLVEDGPKGGEVDLKDAMILLRVHREGIALPCPDAADFNDNGLLDREDFDAFVQALADGIAPAPPYSIPGIDPTPDELDCGLQRSATLVPAGASWRYWYSLDAPGDGWSRETFDDTSWQEGQSGIGFGSATVLTALEMLLSQRRVFYARCRFDISDPAAVNALLLRIDYNDGFVAYINGLEVARRGLGDPGFAIADSAYARYHRGGITEDVFLCREPLRPGENILALEIYNRSRLDRSLFFSAELMDVRDNQASAPVLPRIEGTAAVRVEMEPPPNLEGQGSLGLYCRGDVPVLAGSLALGYSSEHFDFFDPGTEAEFDWWRLSVDDEAGTISCVFVCDTDGQGPLGLPPGVDTELGKLRYTVRAERPGTTRIRFQERPGELPLNNILLGEGGGELELATEDIETEITDIRLPYIVEYVNARGRQGGIFYIVGRHFSSGVNSLRVCGREAEFELLADGQTVQAIAPGCELAGPASVEICTEAGCYLDEEGFFYTEGNGAWVRGDSNGDALIDISDPILMLGRLFLGELTRETCSSALDVNADGAFDISDPIILLRFLFQGDVTLTPPLAASPALCP
ncbi:MAG: hypothetical protein VYC32_07505 [Planctomycetota bacterium]|nr:hypothetical protein [Planctomycetota bacterium]